MATTLQQLLDDLIHRAGASPPTAIIEDATGALAYLGRAVNGLTQDGLTATDGVRQRTAVDLGAACTTAGRLWPATGGPLTDLAGAAADLIGRERAHMGRSQRWTVTVALAEAADACARLGRRLLPDAAVAELSGVRRVAAAVERDAQIDPPSDYTVLDRQVPDARSSAAALTALDASAALTAALDRAQRADVLTLREFRAAVAAAEITTRFAAAIAAAATEDAGGPHLVTGLAWQLAGRASMVFHDGQRAGPTDPRGVVAWARELAGAMRTDMGSYADISALRDRRDVASLVPGVRQILNQLPFLAEQLATSVDRWARSGRLYAAAKDLPPVENMQAERVWAVIAGQTVPARGADFDRLRRTVDRAADLTTDLACVLNHAGTTGPATQRHLAEPHARRVQAPSAAEQLHDHARTVERTAGLHRTVVSLFGRERESEPPAR